LKRRRCKNKNNLDFFLFSGRIPCISKFSPKKRGRTMNRNLDYKLKKALSACGKTDLFLELKASIAQKRGPKPKIVDGCFLIVRLPKAEKDSLKEMAEGKGVSLSDFVRKQLNLS
jgi:hypothetical protein